jgi:hypothetical protein
MAVLKEWSCAAHGEFEAYEGVCPYGCSSRFVKREIRTAPAIRHGKTNNTDNLTKQLAADFSLPDISTRDGDSVMTNLRKKNWAEMKGQPPSVWAGGVPHASPGWSQRGETAPTFDPRGAGMAAGAPLHRSQTGGVVVDTARGQAPIPKVTPAIIKDNKGNPLSYRAPLPEVD